MPPDSINACQCHVAQPTPSYNVGVKKLMIHGILSLCCSGDICKVSIFVKEHGKERKKRELKMKG